MKCKICSSGAQKKVFCMLLFRAYQNVIEKFDVWMIASGTFWIDYLVKIQKNSLTGEWAKDVVKHLFKGENGNVK